MPGGNELGWHGLRWQLPELEILLMSLSSFPRTRPQPASQRPAFFCRLWPPRGRPVGSGRGRAKGRLLKRATASFSPQHSCERRRPGSRVQFLFFFETTHPRAVAHPHPQIRGDDRCDAGGCWLLCAVCCVLCACVAKHAFPTRQCSRGEMRPSPGHQAYLTTYLPCSPAALPWYLSVDVYDTWMYCSTWEQRQFLQHANNVMQQLCTTQRCV